MAVQPYPGDVARHRLIDDGLRGRPECGPFRDADESFQRRRQVQVRLGIVGRGKVVDECHCDTPGLQADLLLAVLEDDLVASGLAGRSRLADTDLGARQALQLQRDVLRDVAHPGTVCETAEEAAPPTEGAGVLLHRGQQRHERLVKARDGVRGVRLQDAQIH